MTKPMQELPMDGTPGFALSPGALARIDALAARYPTKASALMPCLWVIMDELGWVPPGGVDLMVEKLDVTHARVNEVLTFYTMFRDTPQAKHTLQVCHNISCHIMGARPLIRHLEERLGVKLGGRTADGQFQIEGAECLGACGMGPCLQLGTHLYENVTPAKADALLESLRRGVVPRADTDREGVD
ncbi:MAG: NAD(P)H-dependent oxidoreductase subunit E [bacterium]|nr:NAD(P)H-dependent oxidoreductase subunit E [bacterium]